MIDDNSIFIDAIDDLRKLTRFIEEDLTWVSWMNSSKKRILRNKTSIYDSHPGTPEYNSTGKTNRTVKVQLIRTEDAFWRIQNGTMFFTLYADDFQNRTGHIPEDRYFTFAVSSWWNSLKLLVLLRLLFRKISILIERLNFFYYPNYQRKTWSRGNQFGLTKRFALLLFVF